MFVCQHGEAECQNMVIQACIIYGMDGAFKHFVLDLVNCLMGSDQPFVKVEECFKQFKGKF